MSFPEPNEYCDLMLGNILNGLKDCALVKDHHTSSKSTKIVELPQKPKKADKQILAGSGIWWTPFRYFSLSRIIYQIFTCRLTKRCSRTET